ncbi:hypothetical protein SODALDRAFT_9124 [Sodiomyces alkalinus F11]|uniref:Uncharacterized protein n=1 Tax=Sodiomyces alkalinus (strain CBS 110278 / VKM F-3762 / F11) TaxID=1314773 RepID=A0A3N2Q5W2_SODAK|nr:hypothetical protein SODALDRAFT_9124 [Sodiomyces alkalinus F11]ROT42173.1 hypothetical protein SODALDRAFT_9124 [Sodiomyces alkalinus F11]
MYIFSIRPILRRVLLDTRSCPFLSFYLLLFFFYSCYHSCVFPLLCTGGVPCGYGSREAACAAGIRGARCLIVCLCGVFFFPVEGRLSISAGGSQRRVQARDEEDVLAPAMAGRRQGKVMK